MALSQTCYEGLISLFWPKPQHQCYMYRPEKFPEAIRKMSPDECRQHAYEMRPYIHRFVAALRLAVQAGSANYTKALLESCSDKMSKQAYIRALFAAADRNRFDLFEMIIECGAISDTIAHDHLRRSLVTAALNGYMDFAIYSAEMHKKRNFSLNSPAKALDSYIWNVEKEISFKAFEHGAKKEHSLPLHAAVDMNRKNLALYLVQCGANPLQEDHENVTALTIINGRSAKDPQFLHLQLLLQLYISYRKKVADTGSHHLKHPIIFTLCPALVSIHNKDKWGNTLLHAAVKADEWVLAELLLAIEPLLFTEKNNAGYTPFMLCVAHRHEMLTKLIGFAYYANKQKLLNN